MAACSCSTRWRSSPRACSTRCASRSRRAWCACAELAPLAPAATLLLDHVLRAGALSARGLHRVRRVARTLADLAGAGELVDEEHVATALAMRSESVLEAATL